MTGVSKKWFERNENPDTRPHACCKNSKPQKAQIPFTLIDLCSKLSMHICEMKKSFMYYVALFLRVCEVQTNRHIHKSTVACLSASSLCPFCHSQHTQKTIMLIEISLFVRAIRVGIKFKMIVCMHKWNVFESYSSVLCFSTWNHSWQQRIRNNIAVRCIWQTCNSIWASTFEFQYKYVNNLRLCMYLFWNRIYVE